MTQCTPKIQKGFTLIEVMIVVAIVGILSAIAYPSYAEYIRRGHRAEARAGLLQAQQWLERAATATGTYPLTAAFPATMKKVPNDRYDIGVVSDGATFTLTATPKGAQTGDKCGNYTVTNTGLRGAKGVTTGDIVTECWGK
jgi:type IV pilus assembly protein PilE